MSNLSLSDAMHQLMHAYRYLLREGIQKQAITLPVTHIRVLKGICRNPEVTAQSIAQRMQRDKAQITRALNDLLAANLIFKENNPLDRRSQLLRPSPSGKEIMAQIDRAEKEAVTQLTSDLSLEELAFFLRISKTMVDSIEQKSSVNKRAD